MSVVLTFLMVERQVMRGIALKQVYGWRSAIAGCLIPPFLPLRAVWGNIINFLATLSAWRICFFGFPKNRPRWQKTKHSYLPPEVLLRYQRKLGDLALEKQIVAPSVLAELLREAKEKGEKIGEVLIREGAISQEELNSILAEVLKSGYIELDNHSVRITEIAPEGLEKFKKYCVMPVAITKQSVILAAGAPLPLEAQQEIKESLGGRNLSVVLSSPSLIVQALQSLEEPDSLPQFPRLGEKLLDRGLINEEQLVEALRAQKFYPKPLGEILVEMGLVRPEDLEN